MTLDKSSTAKTPLMETLIKLFTEEPVKLERLIILMLKFTLTCVTFEVFYPSYDVIQNLMTVDFKFWPRSSEAVMYVLFFIVWWFVLWFFFAQTLLSATVRFLSRIFNPAKNLGEFLNVLEFFIPKAEGKKHVKYSIFYLLDFLESHQEEEGIDISDLRVDVYFEIYSIATMFIIVSPVIDLTEWQTALWWFIGLNLLFTYAYFHRFAGFINSSYYALMEDAQKLAYIEETRLALSNIPIINDQFKIEHKRRKIYLAFEHPEPLDDTLTIIPFYSKDSPAFREMAETSLRKMANSENEKKQKLFITNIPLQLSRGILQKANYSIIIAETELEMKQGLETYLKIYLQERNDKVLAQIGFRSDK